MANPDDEDKFERTTILTRDQLAAALAGQDDTCHYLLTEGDGPSKRLEIGATPVTIGRDPRRLLSFNDSDLSRFHLQVSLTNGKAVVEDMGSTNGTFVNGERIGAPHTLQDGDTIRAGKQALKYERRNKKDVERAAALERELRAARGYVLALLPEPVKSGPVQVSWKFVPSTQLGGDAFGYSWLDPTTFVFYLIDVSGHGVGSAMHSVAVMNLLRQRALPGVDFTDPAQVLSSLNARFQMETHGGLFFTMWYGVYRTGDRVLTYGSAGHHASILVDANRTGSQELGMNALMIGAMDFATYESAQTTVPPGSSIYVFSDGAFEIETREGQMWGTDELTSLFLQPAMPGASDPDRVHRIVAATSNKDPLSDDFSLVQVTFA